MKHLHFGDRHEEHEWPTGFIYFSSELGAQRIPSIQSLRPGNRLCKRFFENREDGQLMAYQAFLYLSNAHEGGSDWD